MTRVCFRRSAVHRAIGAGHRGTGSLGLMTPRSQVQVLRPLRRKPRFGGVSGSCDGHGTLTALNAGAGSGRGRASVEVRRPRRTPDLVGSSALLPDGLQIQRSCGSDADAFLFAWGTDGSARAGSGVPVLRSSWYDGAKDGCPSTEQPTSRLCLMSRCGSVARTRSCSRRALTHTSVAT